MRKVLALLLLILVFSCKKKEIPQGILSHEKMVKILIDTHIIEAEVNNLKLPKDSSIAVYLALEKQLFKKHKVSKGKYINSFKYYNSHPEKMDDIYAEVVDSLNVRQKILKLE